MKRNPLDPPYSDMMLPGEWEPQQAVWMTWPQNPETWNPVHPEQEKTYAECIQAIRKFEEVNLLVNDAKTRMRLEQMLSGPGPFGLNILVCPTNDSWIRDYGAITVRAGGQKRSELVSLNFRFNSWGGKYPPWDKDDNVPLFMASRRQREVVELDFVLEGGSIDSNGQGKLLTTRQCLLNPNRNPNLDQGKIEEVLNNYLGAQEILWLHGGINGDDTDGHVDDLARFGNARTILCAVETDARDENYEPLKRNMATLEKYAGAMDLEVVEAPMPRRLVKAGLRTPATYLNFLIINGAILVPVFLDKRDDQTLQLFETYFREREIIPIDCRNLVFGQGAIHCSSMQEPALSQP